MSSDAPEQSSTILDGRYRLERVLGEGAFGRVYIAFDTRLQRTVAVKELLSTKTTVDPRLFERYLDRFEREARAAGSVFHPNIVNVFELAIDAHGNYYLIMEYIDGGNLRDLLLQVKTLPVERALRITLEIARALEAIHEMDIVHRDLKPANIMLTRRGVTKLTDFGIAQLGTESHRTQVTVAHPGTPLYMSPEQRQNTDYLDGRTDLYTLGLILYEMLAGEPYARRKQPLDVLRPDLPDAVVGIFRRLTEQDPARRYQSAEALVADLEALTATQSQDSRDATASYMPPGIPDQAARTVIDTREAGTVPSGTLATAPGRAADTARPAEAGTVPWDGRAPSRDAAPATRGARRWPALVGVVAAAVLAIALVGGWFLTRGGTPTVTPLTPTPGSVSGQAASPPPTVTTPPASATAGTSAGGSPTVGPTPSATPPPPTSTPSASPTVVARIPTRPDFQTITNPQYGFSFAYPKSWQRSDDETTKDTLYSVRMSPSAVFVVAKEDNPTFGTLDAYIEDEIKVETTQNAGWKVGPRARQAATISGQEAKIADFLVPTATGQDYHYYVFTLRPNRAWGLLFTMPFSESASFQHDIDDVIRSFAFCTGNACPAQAASGSRQQAADRADHPLTVIIGALPRRRMADA